MVDKKDAYQSSFPMWRIESSKLLQKFEPFVEKNIYQHKSASVVGGGVFVVEDEWEIWREGKVGFTYMYVVFRVVNRFFGVVFLCCKMYWGVLFGLY